jgi:hypothetical protein
MAGVFLVNIKSLVVYLKIYWDYLRKISKQQNTA